MARQDSAPATGRRGFVKGATVAVGGVLAAAAGGLPAAATDEATGTTASTFCPTGPVTVTPADPRYADLVSGLNQRWSARPESVRLVHTTDQVVAAVGEAATAGKRISLRSGGHCYEDFVYNADVQVVIDMSEMDDISYDDRMRAFAVQPGAKLLDVYEVLYKTWGVTFPGGTTATVGVAGLVTGGGYGMLSRRHGLAADHLYAIEVVVVDAAGRPAPWSPPARREIPTGSCGGRTPARAAAISVW